MCLSHVAASYISLAATFLQKSPARSFRRASFSEKGHACFGCSLASALTMPLRRYQLFAGLRLTALEIHFVSPLQTCGRQFVMSCWPFFIVQFDHERIFLSHPHTSSRTMYRSRRLFFLKSHRGFIWSHPDSLSRSRLLQSNRLLSHFVVKYKHLYRLQKNYCIF